MDTDVTRVWWCVASESVQDRSDDAPDYNERMTHVLNALAEHVRQTYPNAADVWIIDGGFGNQYSPFTPRVETDSATPYEHGLDDMIEAEDRAIADAFEKYPTPKGAD